MKFVEKTRGAVSIFLIMIMLPMFVLAGGAVDGSRIHSAKVAITGAGDLAMNAALADYETVLKDVYGLFAMSKTVDELEENVSRYFKNTLENTGVLGGETSYSQAWIDSIVSSAFADGDAPTSSQNVLKATVDSFGLISMNNSMLGNPDVLERQIVEYMKIRGPVSLGKGLLTKLGCLGETSKQTDAIKAKVEYEKDLSSLQEACETAYNATSKSTCFSGTYAKSTSVSLTSPSRTVYVMVPSAWWGCFHAQCPVLWSASVTVPSGAISQLTRVT